MRSVRCARRFRRLRLQPDRQIFISISIRLFLTRLVIGSSLFLIRVHPLTFSTAYPVPSWDRNSCSIVEQWKWKWRCRRKREERKEEDVLEKKNWQVRENHRSRIKSHQLLYPGVPGTAPLAAAAASLCFLFTRKLWNRKVSLSTRIQRSLFPSSISIIVHHRTDKYQRDIRILSKLDSISSRVYFSPSSLHIFYHFIIWYHFPLNQFPLTLPFGDESYLHTRMGLFRYELRGLRPPLVYLKSLLHLRRSDRAVIVFILLPQCLEPLLLSPLLLQLLLLLPKLWQKEKETKKRTLTWKMGAYAWSFIYIYIYFVQFLYLN